MNILINAPFVVFVFSLLILFLSIQIGMYVARKVRPPRDDEREDLTLVVSSSLTLLALIIGFSFSMAVSRYDQRKNLEEEEANAIGTEYVRAGLLPGAEAAQVRSLLVLYLDQRVSFYITRDREELAQINRKSGELQNQMWAIVQNVANAQPTPTHALAVAGMNDVLNSQGYTQAAWWNRIPDGAWILMWSLAVCCSCLIGYSARRKGNPLFTILPILLSFALFLIADIDSPRRGVIRVRPQNLITLADSFHGQ